MTNHTIITIGRQFGSGGHEVGNRLSERLNIPLYDNNLISMAAHELSISQEAAEKVDETILGKFLSAYVVNMRDYTVFINDSNESVPLSDKVYEVQTSIINRLSERGPCISSEDALTIFWEITATAFTLLSMPTRRIGSAVS